MEQACLSLGQLMGPQLAGDGSKGTLLRGGPAEEGKGDSSWAPSLLGMAQRAPQPKGKKDEGWLPEAWCQVPCSDETDWCLTFVCTQSSHFKA